MIIGKSAARASRRYVGDRPKNNVADKHLGTKFRKRETRFILPSPAALIQPPRPSFERSLLENLCCYGYGKPATQNLPLVCFQSAFGPSFM
jgi:hypothetical protein